MPPLYPGTALKRGGLLPVAEHRWEALVHERNPLVCNHTAMHAEIFQHRPIKSPGSISAHQLAQQCIDLRSHQARLRSLAQGM